MPFWGGLQLQEARHCRKLYAQPLHNGGVLVTFDHLNEFAPCYLPPQRRTTEEGSSLATIQADDAAYRCFEHIRLRVKDLKSVPGWSLQASESPKTEL